MKTERTITFSTANIVKIFKALSPKQQLTVASKINDLVFAEQWQLLDKTLPDINMSDDEIMKEVKAVRYGKRQIKNIKNQ